jgi:hypothetical protein
MQTQKTLLRGASAFALAVALVGTSLVAPAATPAAAAPAQRINGNDNDDGNGGGIADVPIIGEIVSGFEGQEPEDVAVGAIQFTAAAAETVVPMVIRLFK